MDFSVFRNNFIRGNKSFELTNHLGNVLATVSDKKIQHNTSGTAVDWYNAEVVTAQDYFVFGMEMPGRGYSLGSSYRYGFNGKENDKSISQEDFDFGERFYDGRLGRFLSIDKFAHNQPFYSPYIFAGDKPVLCIDKEGNQEIIVTVYERQSNGALIKTAECSTWINTVEEAKGIHRDPYRINVVYEWQQHSKQINPTKNLISAKPDENTGLNDEEKQKKEEPFDYYADKVMTSIVNVFGVADIAKGSKDDLYGYGQEESGENITEEKAEMYRISGGIKLTTSVVTGSASALDGKVASWGAWQMVDLGVEGLTSKFNDWGLGQKGNNLLYSVFKLGKAFVSFKDANKYVDAIELASEIANTGLKGADLEKELETKGVNMSDPTAADQNDAANQALVQFKDTYQTNGDAAQIQPNDDNN